MFRTLADKPPQNIRAQAALAPVRESLAKAGSENILGISANVAARITLPEKWLEKPFGEFPLPDDDDDDDVGVDSIAFDRFQSSMKITREDSVCHVRLRVVIESSDRRR